MAFMSNQALAVRMARRRMASTMRKMQVPAYAPALDGVHDSAYNMVLVAVKKDICIPIEPWSISMAGAAVAVGVWECPSWATIVSERVWRR